MQPPKLQNIPNMAVIGKHNNLRNLNVTFWKTFLLLIRIYLLWFLGILSSFF
jgi:hypothetical protein